MNQKIRSGLTRIGLTFLIAAVVLILGAWAWLELRGEVVTWRPRMGETRGSEPVRFAERGAETTPVQDFPTDARPRNVILIIADGMGFSQVAAARAQLAGLESRLFFERLPVVGWQMTWSEQNLITDSAAAASALATGTKVPSGAVSKAFDGRELPTVMERAIERGMRSGLITDSYFWDATPAAFVAHVHRRGESDEIRAQLAASGVDLLVGGRGSIEPASETGRRLEGLFTDQGYSVVWEWSDGDPWPAQSRAAAFLAEDAIAGSATEPSLADLTDLALQRLDADQGFFLMVETEETDTASHQHDFRRLVAGIEKLEEAVRRAVAFAEADRETLVLLTSDHETGGLALISGRAEQLVGVSWATTSHSAEPVPIYAYGPGAERFGAVLDNTDIARHLAELLELDMF